MEKRNGSTVFRAGRCQHPGVLPVPRHLAALPTNGERNKLSSPMAVSYSECDYFVADNGVTLGAVSRNRIIADASV